MDSLLEVCGGEDFDAAEWVDRLASTKPASSSIESHLVSHLTTLQVASQDMSYNIHLLMQQLSHAVPRTQTQVQDVERRTKSLLRTIGSVQREVGSSGKENLLRRNEAISILTDLDSAKTSMEKCCQTLEEAAKWTRHVHQIRQLLEGQDLEGASEQLCSLQQTLEVLKDMKGYEERRESLLRLRDQLESKVEPNLRDVLKDPSANFSQLLQYVQVYKNLGTLSHLVDLYTSVRLESVPRLWYSFNTTTMTGTNSEDMVNSDNVRTSGSAFSGWLRAFYDEFFDLIEAELKQSLSLFGSDGILVTQSILLKCFTPFVESFQSRLVDHFLVENEFLDCLDCTMEFLERIQNRIGKELELITDSSSVEFDFLKVAELYTEPYERCFHQYDELERWFITREVLNLLPINILSERAIVRPTSTRDRSQDHMDGNIDDGLHDDDDFFTSKQNPIDLFSTEVEENAESIIKVLECSFQRCTKFTTGAGYPQLLRAYQESIEEVAVCLISSMSAVRTLAGLNAPPKGGGGPSTATVSVADWSSLESGLSMLRAFGKVTSVLVEFKAELDIEIREQLVRFRREHPSKKHPNQQQQQTPNSSRSALLSALNKRWTNTAVEMDQKLHALHADFCIADRIENKPFDSAMKSLMQWKGSIDQFIFDLMLRPIEAKLKAVHEDKVWAKESTTNNVEDDMLSYGTHPQEYITSIADLVLSLIPELEPFAFSTSVEEALRVTVDELFPLVRAKWSKVAAMLQLKHSELDTFMVQNIRLAGQSEDKEDVCDSGPAQEPSVVVLDSSNFVDCWTNAATSACLATFMHMMLRVSKFSPYGCQQALSDLEYFANVLSAVGVHIPAVVHSTQFVLKLSQQELEAQLRKHTTMQRNFSRTESTARHTTPAAIDRHICRLFARKRGILLTFDE